MVTNAFLVQPTPFVGRSTELAELSARLSSTECRLLTLTGLGGSGKTRLAIEAARTAAPNFQHGVVFAALQQLAKADLLVPTIAQAIGLTFYGKDEPETQLFNYLREKSLLLLLDNFEHLLDGAALISTMLGQAPGVKLLVTSREALNLREEWLYPLGGMTIPPSIYTDSLEGYEAVQLFLYHARRIQPGFELAKENESVIQISKLTAGIPLAIELAASWLHGLSASQIVAEMQRSLDIFSTKTRNIEERHRSMRAVFDHSWTLMSENERLVFAAMSVFRGSFDRSAAEQIAGASLGVLAALAEKSLIQTGASNRFSIHELLRQYGMEKLEAYGQKEAIYALHSQYYAQFMRQNEAGLKQAQQREVIRAIENDLENIRQAWEWATENHQVSLLHDMLESLYLFGFLRSRYRETIAMFEQALESSISDSALLERLLVRRWGYLHWWYQVDFDEAKVEIQRALALAEAENNVFEIALCHLMYGYTLINTNRFAEALPHLETSRMQFESIHEPYYVCWVLHRIGYAYSNFNESEKSDMYTEQSLVLARATHNWVALAVCLYNLGSSYIFNGDYVRGRNCCAEALQIASETGHQDQIAHALSLLALCAFCEGHYDLCQDYAQRSQTIIEEINAHVFAAYNLSLYIVLACLHEDYQEGTRISETQNHPSTNKMGLQLLYWACAMLCTGMENRGEARRYVRQALELTDMETEPVVILLLLPFAILDLSERESSKAVELLSWCSMNTDPALIWIRQWSFCHRLQSQLENRLPEDVYESHWRKGKTLTRDMVTSWLTRAVDAEPAAEADQHLLTARESDILHLMAAGLTNPQIAEKLVIGTGTVKTHTLSIYRKLDVANRTQAILRAQELGLLDP